MDFVTAFIVLVVLMAVIAAIFFGHLAAKKRCEALAALAAELDWTFDPSRNQHHDDEFAHFEIFRRGFSRFAYNTLTGTLTIHNHIFQCRMGDFTYKQQSNSGKSQQTTTYRFSYLILHLPFQHVADLLIRPEGIFDKLAGVFGFDDIDFESAQFSRRFLVKSSDRRFAYDVIDPRMIEFLLANAPAAVDIERGRCCLSDGRKRWSPQEFQHMLHWSTAFFEHWPRHVIDRLESEATLTEG